MQLYSSAGVPSSKRSKRCILGGVKTRPYSAVVCRTRSQEEAISTAVNCGPVLKGTSLLLILIIIERDHDRTCCDTKYLVCIYKLLYC